MKIAKLIATAAALCAGLTGMVSEAHAAGFSVVVDCYGDNGQPNWADSNNSITVRVLINGSYMTLGSLSGNNCGFNNSMVYNYAAFSAADVTRVRISTNGSDAFFTDKVLLKSGMNGSGSTVAQWGIDNNVGYCLSSDGGDGNNAYCRCSSRLGPRDFNGIDRALGGPDSST